MFLKRLELHGFKSFADKTKLDFQPGVTLVVGPNGSGKSNIADAVRWVLGEQSAKSLRGGKMEDVIFAGSDKRKSLGMAEVSLTLDNSSGAFPLDFNEVTVTRRLYRSGESEYLINKVTCRLKDIHELFMDTGIGREGFSMIGQGRVEEILTARPEERRGILEDAAGIIKYRYRKKEASKKLFETEQHLLRIEDILLELRSQEEPLGKQAEEAKTYQILKKELDELEVGMISGEIRLAGEKLKQLQIDIAANEEAMLKHKTGFMTAQSREEGIRLALDRQGEELARLQDHIYQQSLKIEKLMGENRSDEDRRQSLEDQAVNLEQEKSQYQQEWQEVAGKWQARQEEGAELAQKLEAARQILTNEEIAQKAMDAEIIEQRQALAVKEDDHFDLLKKDSSSQNEAVRHQQELLSMNRQQERLEENRRQINQTIEDARQQQVHLTEQHQQLEAFLDQQATELNGLQAKVQAAKDAHGQQQQLNRQIAGERSQALSKYKILEEMEKEGQGYSQGVREVLHRKGNDWIRGVKGTVAQNLRVDQEYEMSVEVALGAATQNIITETEKCAQEAMRWLKNHDKGRVTFLPLDIIRARAVPTEGVPRGKGMLGRMVDLVDFQDELLPVMEFLLGRIWVADQLSNAVARAKENGFRYRIVTLDGQVVNAGGSLTGGSVRLNTGGVISRRRQIEELDREIRKLSQQIVKGEEVEAQLAEELKAVETALERATERLQEAKVELATLDNNLRHGVESVSRLERELETMNWQQEEWDEEQARLTGALQLISQQRGDLAELIRTNEAGIAQLKEQIAQGEGQRTQRQSHLTELRIQVAANEERLNAFDNEGAFLKARSDQLQGIMNSQTENAALCRNRAKQHAAAYALRQKEIEALQEDINLQEVEKQSCQQQRQALQEQVSSLDENQRAIAAELAIIEERLRQLQIQEGRHQANLEEWDLRLQEQFGLTLAEAAASIEPVQERRKAQQRIKELRNQVGAMQQVNLGAVEEYERLVERLNFLNEQTEDLIKAKADLEQVIHNMDQLVAKKFKETFEQINLSFNEVFQRLFDGGRAHLYLTDPDDVLDSGVDIMAQPPGKKTQHLSLLSGGEKALTAIALLLAMLRVRPSPFSILDEIESNLDEANVDRFAALVKEYCQDGGQFIVITHRRGTMEVGDVIYGVSAEEASGVSKVISVRMTER